MTLFHKLPIRTREVFTGDSGCEQAKTVFCPYRNAARALEDCDACPFARSIESDVVVCVRGKPPEQETFEIGRDPRVDVQEAAARTRLNQIVSTEVVCVRPDTSIDSAMSLLVTRVLTCLPVVDADNKLVGIVSRADCLRDQVDHAGEESPAAVVLDRGFHLEPTSARPVSEIMTPCVHALPEDAPVSFALSLMAFQSIHEVPIVSKDGKVIGVATALDLLRWLAERMGYVLASPKRS